MRYTLFPLLMLVILIASASLRFRPIEGATVSEKVQSIPIVLPTPSTFAKTKTPRIPAFVNSEFDGNEITRTDAEWKRLLSPAAFNVMRKEGTEAPYSGTLVKNHKHGTYYCAACRLALFSSKAKYDSQTGWPSFYEPIYKKNVIEKEDRSLGEVRTEVECARCKAHLGHVFDDGPQPTGLRYCMNSVALTFRPSK